jgi:acetolactate synthase-1/2/3 large subunit
METATEGASATALVAPSAAGEQRTGLTVAQLLLEYLKLEEATTIFGIPGGAAVWIIDELKKQDTTFDFVVCRQETGAAYMAHGYAWAGGGLGVVLTTSGPAAANALTGTVNADTACCPLLTITGEVPEKAFGKGYLQEGIDAGLDIDTIYRNAISYSAVVANEYDAATLIEQALRVARSQPSRAAHLSIPNDVAGTCVTDPTGKTYTTWFPSSPRRYRTVPSGTDDAAVKVAFGDLSTATRPLIFLGNGARAALSDPDRLARFTKFVATWALPVMTTPDAKGIFPEDHALSLRNYGICACAWPDVYMGTPGSPNQFDALLVLGSSLGELATTVVNTDQFSKNLIPTEHFIQVDLDEGMIGRNFPITRGIVGDVGATIEALLGAAAGKKPDQASTKTQLELIASIKATTSPFADPKGRDSQNAPTHPAALMRVINETMASGHIFIDAGNCVGWSLNDLVVKPPLAYHSALDMGPMGFGVCAVVGAKIAAPDETCLAIVGDGALMMHAAEVSTAAAQGVDGAGAIWVVLYDNDLAMVSQGMGELFPPSSSWTNYYALGAPDLVKVAEGFGAEAVGISRTQGPEDFRQALETAIQNANQNNKPQVIVVEIDTQPMPPYGWPQMPAPPCAPTADGSEAKG